MSRVDYARIPELHAAARRQRAQAIAHSIGLAFAWLVSSPRIALRSGWRVHVQGRAAQG